MKKVFSGKMERLIDFVQFTHEFQEVVRVARPPHRKRYENDAEHSYQLAMVAWFLIDQDKLKLNKELCFMYALAHDLVEIYAGDTWAYDKAAQVTKHKREQAALKKIQKRFAHFKALTKIIESYEEKKDPESRFIYALDKILPPLQCYLEDGKLWHETKTSFVDMLASKDKKIPVSSDVNVYWQELRVQLEKKQKKLFLK